MQVPTHSPIRANTRSCAVNRSAAVRGICGRLCVPAHSWLPTTQLFRIHDGFFGIELPAFAVFASVGLHNGTILRGNMVSRLKFDHNAENLGITAISHTEAAWPDK